MGEKVCRYVRFLPSSNIAKIQIMSTHLQYKFDFISNKNYHNNNANIILQNWYT